MMENTSLRALMNGDSWVQFTDHLNDLRLIYATFLELRHKEGDDHERQYLSDIISGLEGAMDVLYRRSIPRGKITP